MSVTTYLGDCLEIMPTLDPGSIDMVLTDLPYGTTQNRWDTELPLDRLWDEWHRLIKPGSAVVLFGQQPFTSKLGMSNIKELRYEWIYEKGHPTGFLNANRAPMKAHENVLVFCSKGAPYHPVMNAESKTHHAGIPKKSSNYGDYDPAKKNLAGQGYPKSILRYDEWKGWIHPTQKPVGLCEYLIRTYTEEGMTVLDCCMGSGTTGVACIRTGRDFVGIERDPDYYAKAVERLEAERSSQSKTGVTLDSFAGVSP